MKKLITLSIVLAVAFMGEVATYAQGDGECTPDGVVKSFAEAVSTGALSQWLEGYQKGNCSEAIKDGAKALADAYAKMPVDNTATDLCKGKPSICNFFVDPAQLQEAKAGNYAGGGGKLTARFTANCARTGKTGLQIDYETAGEGQFGGFLVDWSKSSAGEVDLSGYKTFSIWAKAITDQASFQLGMLDTVIPPGSEPRVETLDWVSIDNSDWIEITFPMGDFNEPEKILNFGAIRNLSIGFNPTHGKGSVCVDDLAFIK